MGIKMYKMEVLSKSMFRSFYIVGVQRLISVNQVTAAFGTVPSIGYFSRKIQDKKVDSFLRKERAKIT